MSKKSNTSINKNIIIGVIALLVVGAGAYFFLGSNSTGGGLATVVSNSASGPTSLRALMGLGSSQMCTFTDDDSGSEGTMYIAGGRVRGDFDVVSDSQTLGSHMIMRDDTMYMWMDGQEDGFMMNLSDFEQGEVDDSQMSEQAQPVDLDQQVDYRCNRWTVDSSKFQVPQEREFMDFSSMMQGAGMMMEQDEDAMMEGVPDASQQCAACESLPDEAKAQCLQALGC